MFAQSSVSQATGFFLQGQVSWAPGAYKREETKKAAHLEQKQPGISPAGRRLEPSRHTHHPENPPKAQAAKQQQQEKQQRLPSRTCRVSSPKATAPTAKGSMEYYTNTAKEKRWESCASAMAASSRRLSSWNTPAGKTSLIRSSTLSSTATLLPFSKSANCMKKTPCKCANRTVCYYYYYYY